MKKYKKLIIITKKTKMKLLLQLKTNRDYRFKNYRFKKISK